MKAKTLLINFLIFLTLIFLLELSAGLFLKEDNSNEFQGIKRCIQLREHEPGKKFIVQPDSVYKAFTENLDTGTFNVLIDKHGFISNHSISEEKDKVIFFGGSTTECLYMPDTLRFPYLVEKRLGERGYNVKVYNSGVSGNNSMHSLNNLINKGIPLNPKYCVLMHNINDLNILLYEGSYFNDNPSKKLVMDMPQSAKANLKGSLLLVIQNIFSNTISLIKQNSYSKNPRDEFEKTRNNTTNNLKSELYSKSIRTFIQTCKNFNIQPILVTQFNRLSPPFNGIIYENPKNKLKHKGHSIEKYSEQYKSFNDTIRAISLRENTKLIDLDSLVKENNMLYDVCHLNSSGSLFVSKIISDSLSNWMEKNNI
ncbi:MAG: hypothetical protein CMP67_04360 [Flavobacteriales bacterium]|nr:hypothetical protein [Flavobacteriales bacterium]|tara:strand:- start:1253 stop:2356 length:1104 start_codon:yes stop_codon:yes gene_type:complete